MKLIGGSISILTQSKPIAEIKNIIESEVNQINLD
jgi:hypothetical protein